MTIKPCQTTQDEANYLLKIHDQCMSTCIRFVQDQFNVIQARSQFLLTLGTLTLTITGFSGPKIATTNLFSRYSIAGGIFLVLCSMLVLLLGTHHIRWITQIKEADSFQTLVSILSYRNAKTRLYIIELYLLVSGLSLYVASVISFLVFYQF